MITTITVNPTNPASLAEARAKLDRLERLEEEASLATIKAKLTALDLSDPKGITVVISLLEDRRQKLTPNAGGVDFNQRISESDIYDFQSKAGFAKSHAIYLIVWLRENADLDLSESVPLGMLAKLNKQDVIGDYININIWDLLMAFLLHKGTYPGAAKDWSPPAP